ncbi:hypothetical protein [Nannocystis sp.]|uniref:hypothetical protein n=1 Tax=Nannocystis sp. TaxID=1962667 RepID=UPI00242098C3|nr:hypothetical protein [Nannocystis sp.]MBK7829201.1 hypothetical protein [Nannocystis sp.]MBK9751970.1 hypothetical protein [Nannocystis sp.]
MRRVSDERAAAYDFAEASAMFGRSDAALASVAELDAQRPTRLIVEGVLALHHWMRTGEARHADVVRRSFQMLLARQPQNPYALVLGLRYFLHAAKLEPLMLGLAWQTCQERLSWLERGDQEVVGRAEVLARCAEVALASDRPSESRRLFARALEIDPHQAEGRLRWAGLELDAGNVIVAAELFSAATNAPRSYHRLAAQMGLGVTRARMRDGPGAEKAYREAITAFHQWAAPENGALPKEILYNLGVVLASSADPLLRGEARELLQEFIARPDADEVRALRCRQMLHELKGEFP